MPNVSCVFTLAVRIMEVPQQPDLAGVLAVIVVLIYAVWIIVTIRRRH